MNEFGQGDPLTGPTEYWLSFAEADGAGNAGPMGYVLQEPAPMPPPWPWYGAAHTGSKTTFLPKALITVRRPGANPRTSTRHRRIEPNHLFAITKTSKASKPPCARAGDDLAHLRLAVQARCHVDQALHNHAYARGPAS